MNICLAGKNKIAVDALSFLLNKGIEKENIYACVNKSDNGKNDWQPSFKAICNRDGISIKNIEDLYSIENLLFFSLEFDQIIAPQKFKSDNLFNIHFSKLPAYKGMYTSIMPILCGESASGVTLHLIDRGIDTGDIVDQINFTIPQHFNGNDLYNSYLKNGLILFKKNINDILNNNYSARLQPKNDSSYYSKQAIDFSDIAIDYNKTAFEIKNQIRAFAFRSYQLPLYKGVKLTHALIEEGKSYEKPGTKLSETSNSFLISSIDFNIRLFKDKLDTILDAARSGNLEKLQYLKQKKYKLYEKNNKGWNALIVAAYNEQKDVCKWLLQQGLNPNSVNNNGTSVLMYACTAASKSNKLGLIKLLINAGADIDHRDLYGKSILEYSKKYENEQIYNFLIGRV